MKFNDPGDGIDDNGGAPVTRKVVYVYATWQWPSNVPNPTCFEAITFLGTDPTTAIAILAGPTKTADGSVRDIQWPIRLKAGISNANAAVRPIW